MSQIKSAEHNDVQRSEPMDIHDVSPLGENDYDCLKEVRNVLKRHGKQNRFGVMLIHKHFDVSEDEVIMEFTDVEARVQTSKPIKKSEILGNSIETSWILQDGPIDKMLDCQMDCWMNAAGKHVS